MARVIVLGNELLEEDSFAKKVCSGMEIVRVNDSFELIDILNSEDKVTIIDVVQGLDKVMEIKPEDLRQDSFLSAHDFDAGFLIGLMKPNARIIGIPQSGDEEKIRGDIRKLLEPVNF